MRCRIAPLTWATPLRAIENIALAVGLVLLQAWCVGCMFVFIKGAQALSLPAPADRFAALGFGAAGFLFAMWTTRLLWLWWRRR